MWRPGKNFRVGAMRDQITIQSHTSTRDTSGQNVSTWADSLSNVPARHFDTGGGTSYRGQQLEESIVAVFVVRFNDTINTKQQVVWNGTNYGITRVNRVDGGRRYLELFCRGVAA